jgi:GntR family transcriptional regulator of arabinose operon
MRSVSDGVKGAVGTQRLSYKFQRLREEIRQDIQGGRFGEKLPGERQLAQLYKANAKTINKALTDLTVEGLLTRHVGRGTFVGSDPSSRADRTKTLGWVCSQQSDQTQAGRWFDLARDALAKQGHVLELAIVEPTSDGELPERALRPGKLGKWDGLLVFGARPSQGFLADLIRRHLPVVTLEVFGLAVKTNSVTADYSQGAYELTSHLIRLGHEKVRLVSIEPEGRSGGVASHGYQAAMGRFGLEFSRPCFATGTNHEINGLPTVVHEAVFGGADRPTAVVVLGVDLAGAVVAEAVRRRSEMSGALSVAVLAEPGRSLDQDKGWASYEAPVEELVRWATWLLVHASPGQEPRHVVVPGQMVVGSLAGCAASGTESVSHPVRNTVI